MQNYHRHSSYSNIFTPDSSVTNEQYAKRAVELGHKIISSVEHGWQGYYFECFELAKKYNLKFVFGTEAYWVKDRKEKDKNNCHIIILAKNENGRQAINEILYKQKTKDKLDNKFALCTSVRVHETDTGYAQARIIDLSLHSYYNLEDVKFSKGIFNS